MNCIFMFDRRTHLFHEKLIETKHDSKRTKKKLFKVILVLFFNQ